MATTAIDAAMDIWEESNACYECRQHKGHKPNPLRRISDEKMICMECWSKIMADGMINEVIDGESFVSWAVKNHGEEWFRSKLDYHGGGDE